MPRKAKKAVTKRKPGRPPEPVPKDVADAVCAWIAEGKTLREFCRMEGAPGFRTVYDWCDKDPEFAARLTRAREVGFGIIAEEAMAIADDGNNDYMERFDDKRKSRGWKVNGEHVQRSKLRVETRLKLLACWDPKRYGNKVAVDSNAKVEHSGKIATGPEVPPTGDLLAGIKKLGELADELIVEEQD